MTKRNAVPLGVGFSSSMLAKWPRIPDHRDMDFQTNITHQERPGSGLKYRFAGIDLAPNVQLESGFSVVDRERTLIRMEKLYTDAEMIQHVMDLGPASGTIVVIDMPKSLSVQGRWRQEEIKMHPLRLNQADGSAVDRYEQRGRRMLMALQEKGVEAYLYYNYLTRLSYDLLLPYRSRSPQGCRALQTALSEVLGVKNMPTNLAPSSVLESIVGSYASWTMWAGQAGKDYELYEDGQGFPFFVSKRRPQVKKARIRTPFRLRRRR